MKAVAARRYGPPHGCATEEVPIPASGRANLAPLERWYRDRRLAPPVAAEFPPERFAEAAALAADRQTAGCVVLTIT